MTSFSMNEIFGFSSTDTKISYLYLLFVNRLCGLCHVCVVNDHSFLGTQEFIVLSGKKKEKPNLELLFFLSQYAFGRT